MGRKLLGRGKAEERLSTSCCDVWEEGKQTANKRLHHSRCYQTLWARSYWKQIHQGKKERDDIKLAGPQSKGGNGTNRSHPGVKEQHVWQETSPANPPELLLGVRHRKVLLEQGNWVR